MCLPRTSAGMKKVMPDHAAAHRARFRGDDGADAAEVRRCQVSCCSQLVLLVLEHARLVCSGRFWTVVASHPQDNGHTASASSQTMQREAYGAQPSPFVGPVVRRNWDNDFHPHTHIATA